MGKNAQRTTARGHLEDATFHLRNARRALKCAERASTDDLGKARIDQLRAAILGVVKLLGRFQKDLTKWGLDR